MSCDPDLESILTEFVHEPRSVVESRSTAVQPSLTKGQLHFSIERLLEAEVLAELPVSGVVTRQSLSEVLLCESNEVAMVVCKSSIDIDDRDGLHFLRAD